MALFKHAGGFADRFSIKDETTWAESRNSNVEKETDHFLMEMAQLGAKSFTKLVSEYLKRPGLGSSHLPKNLPALQRKLALDPSWGTYNPENWKILDSCDSSARNTTGDTYFKAFIAWPHKTKSDKGSTFKPFPRLPPELRIKIWKHALPDGRILPLYQRPPTTPISNSYRLRANHYDLAHRYLACRESWAVFLDHYGKIKIKNMPVDHPFNYVQGYFDMNRDTLCIYELDIEIHKVDEMLDLSQIRHIAIGLRGFIPWQKTYWASIQTSCPLLRSFTIIPKYLWQSMCARNDLRQHRLVDLEGTCGDFRDLSSQILENPKQYWNTESYSNEFVVFPEFFDGHGLVLHARTIKQLFEQDVSYDRLPNLEFKVSVMMLEETGVRRWWTKRHRLVPVHKLPFEVEFFTYEPIFQDPHTIQCVDEVWPWNQRVTHIFYKKDDDSFVGINDTIHELFDDEKVPDSSEKEETGLRRMRHTWKP